MEKGKLVEMSPEEREAIEAIEGAVKTLRRHGWSDTSSSRNDLVYTETFTRKNGKEEHTRRYAALSLRWSQSPREAQGEDR